MIDMQKSRRETLRWLILLTLNSARPIGAGELLVMEAVRQAQPDVTPREIRLELDYLRDRGLVKLEDGDVPQWFAELTRDGVDVVEYTVECDPGIARPKKYW